MLIKKGWKKKEIDGYEWKVIWNKSSFSSLSNITFPISLKKPGGLKKKKQPLKQIIPEIELSPPLGKIFWCDPILGKN